MLTEFGYEHINVLYINVLPSSSIVFSLDYDVHFRRDRCVQVSLSVLGIALYLVLLFTVALGSHKRGTIPDVGSKRINNGKVSTDLSEISGSHDVCPDDGGGMHL
jgi:hypothetical protein